MVKVPLRIRIREAGTVRQASRKYKKEMGRGMACTTMWNNNKVVFLCVRKRPHTMMLKQKKIPFFLAASLLFSFSHTDMPVCTQYYVNSLFSRVLLSLSEHPLGHLGSLIKTMHSIH